MENKPDNWIEPDLNIYNSYSEAAEASINNPGPKNYRDKNGQLVRGLILNIPTFIFFPSGAYTESITYSGESKVWRKND